VRVLSSHGGMNELQVRATLGTSVTKMIPKAVNDDVTTTASTSPIAINVLANDTVGTKPIVFGPNVLVAIVGGPVIPGNTALVRAFFCAEHV
jgi:hypothetical protein